MIVVQEFMRGKVLCLRRLRTGWITSLACASLACASLDPSAEHRAVRTELYAFWDHARVSRGSQPEIRPLVRRSQRMMPRLSTLIRPRRGISTSAPIGCMVAWLHGCIVAPLHMVVGQGQSVALSSACFQCAAPWDHRCSATAEVISETKHLCKVRARCLQ
jgi:hypothetical protein